MTDFARLVLDTDTRGLRDGERALDSLSDKSKRTAKDVDGGAAMMTSAFKRVGGALVASFSVAEFVRLADTFSSMNAQLRLVTSSTVELAEVQERLFQISQSNRVSFESTVELYARIARSTEALGVSQGDVLRVTDTINKALVISGTSAQEASGALLQLGQAFASGALRGDELNSILEGMPRVAKAIADGMGITVGQLRALGAEGVLTSEAVFNALLKMSEGIDAEFGRMPVTVGQSLTMVGNSVLNLVGEFDQASNSSAYLADNIVNLSQALDGSTMFVRAFGAEIDKAFQGLGFLASKAQDVADTFLSYYIPAVNKTRQALRWLGVPILGNDAGGGGNTTLDVVNALKRTAQETAPPVERLGATANRTGIALTRSLGRGGDDASRSLRTASREAENTARKMQALTDRLFPLEASMRQFNADKLLIESNKKLTEARKAEILAALEQERIRKRAGEFMDLEIDNRQFGLIGQMDALRSASLGFDATLGAADFGIIGGFAESFEKFDATLGETTDNAQTQTTMIADSFAQMSQRITSSLQTLVSNIRSGGFLSIFSGILDIFMQLGSAGVFGKSIQANLNKPVAGARAMGGQVNAGRTYLVGERGPELFTPSGHGRIIANDNMGGGMVFNIDARGATDPEAVRQQVQQGILEAAPSIVAAAEQRTISSLRRPRLAGVL